jgi:hypothetical protein
MREKNTSLSFKLASQLNAFRLRNPPHIGIFKRGTICPLFRAFETALLAQLRGKPGTEGVSETLFQIWEKQILRISGDRWWAVSVSLRAPFAGEAPEEGMVSNKRFNRPSTTNPSQAALGEIDILHRFSWVGERVAMTDIPRIVTQLCDGPRMGKTQEEDDRHR